METETETESLCGNTDKVRKATEAVFHRVFTRHSASIRLITTSPLAFSSLLVTVSLSPPAERPVHSELGRNHSIDMVT